MTRVVEVTFECLMRLSHRLYRETRREWMSLVWQRCIVGWNRLIGVRWRYGTSNERLACWHDSFHTSAKLRWVSRKLLSFSSLTVWELMQTLRSLRFYFLRSITFPPAELTPADICRMAVLHISSDPHMMTHTVNPWLFDSLWWWHMEMRFMNKLWE